MTLQKCDRCGETLPVVNPLHFREFTQIDAGILPVQLREVTVYYRVDGDEQDICKTCLIHTIQYGKEI